MVKVKEIADVVKKFGIEKFSVLNDFYRKSNTVEEHVILVVIQGNTSGNTRGNTSGEEGSTYGVLHIVNDTVKTQMTSDDKLFVSNIYMEMVKGSLVKVFQEDIGLELPDQGEVNER